MGGSPGEGGEAGMQKNKQSGNSTGLVIAGVEVRGKKESRVIPRYLVWATEWMVVSLTEIALE